MVAIRIPFAVLVGALFSAALFLGLWRLVGVQLDAQPLAVASRIDFTPQRVDTPLVTKRDEKITREPPTLQPTGPELIVDHFGGTTIRPIAYTRPEVGPVVRTPGTGLRGVDGDVLPLVRPIPEYPQRAIAGNIEGWVQLRFNVTAAGTVRDAFVVASEPGTIFDEAALKAIARWRYSPRVDGGVAVERVGLQTIIRFELDH